MRRGVGVAHVQNKEKNKQAMGSMGEQLTAARIAAISDNLDMLEQKARELVKRHEKDIKEDPVLRAKLKKITDALGVDLFQQSELYGSKNAMWARMMGVGKYYDDLASRCVEFCRMESRRRGNLIPFRLTLDEMRKQLPQCNVVARDIVTALKRLEPLQSGGYVVVMQPVATAGASSTDENLEGRAKTAFIRCSSADLSTDVVAVIGFVTQRIARGPPPLSSTSSPSTSPQTRKDPTVAWTPPPRTLPGGTRTTTAMSRAVTTTSTSSAPQTPPSELLEKGTEKGPSAVEVEENLRRVAHYRVTVQDLASQSKDSLKWTERRSALALKECQSEADSWIDDVDGSHWFPFLGE